MRLPNQNPNELAGSEVRPQPPHCDKNSYIFESPPFQCWRNHKAQGGDRQPVILAADSRGLTQIRVYPRRSAAQFPLKINPPRVFKAKEVSQLAIILAIVNHKIRNLPRLQ